MADLMSGKRGLVMGVANHNSIAWGIAQALAAEGAELAFSYQGEAFGKRLQPLAESVGSDLLVDMDVTDDAALDTGFAQIAERWGYCPKRPPFDRAFWAKGLVLGCSPGQATNPISLRAHPPHTCCWHGGCGF